MSVAQRFRTFRSYATAVHNSRNGSDAIVERMDTPFGEVIIFTDPEARDSYGQYVQSLRATGEETFTRKDSKDKWRNLKGEAPEGSEVVIVAWGQP